MPTRTVRKTKKEVLAEFRTVEILEAARRVFARQGFYDTTMEDIAEEAGVSKGTIYIYYPSKNDIYRAAIVDGLLALHAKLKTELATPGAIEEKIHHYIAAKASYFHQNRDFFKIYFSELGNSFCHPVHMQKEIKDLYKKQTTIL